MTELDERSQQWLALESEAFEVDAVVFDLDDTLFTANRSLGFRDADFKL